jgi:eukaryotic translation initiation factor 2C
MHHLSLYSIICLLFTHRINVKLGGINTVPDPASAHILADPRQPTLVLGIEFSQASLCMELTNSTGADVIHPAPGATGRPSFTALVGNVDSDVAKYIATTNVQASRQEMISDLGSMTQVSAKAN